MVTRFAESRLLSEVFKWLWNLYLLWNTSINSEDFASWDFDFKHAEELLKGVVQNFKLFLQTGEWWETQLAGSASVNFSMSRTWLLRIWLLFLCRPFWNLFSLEFVLTSEDFMISAEELKVHHLGSDIFPGTAGKPLTSEILPEHSMEMLWLQWSLRYKERLTVVRTFHSALDNLKFKIPALHDPIHLDFSGPFFRPFLKKIWPVWNSKTKVLVKRQPDSAC